MVPERKFVTELHTAQCQRLHSEQEVARLLPGLKSNRTERNQLGCLHMKAASCTPLALHELIYKLLAQGHQELFQHETTLCSGRSCRCIYHMPPRYTSAPDGALEESLLLLHDRSVGAVQVVVSQHASEICVPDCNMRGSISLVV